MCGIGGFFLKRNTGFEVAEVLQGFSEMLSHRGPDDEGFVVWDENKQVNAFGGSATVQDWFQLADSHVHIRNHAYHPWIGGMVHRRLAIMDLTVLGHQPYVSSSASALTYNGEIYNYQQLIEGYHPISDSDTEVLSVFLEQFGVEALQRLDGMFAFGWLDTNKQRLHLVRDRMGVKPLYFLDTPNFFAFASEPVVLHCLLQRKPELNRTLIAEYLMRGIVEYDGPGFWEPVKELKPGHRLEYNLRTGTWEIKDWFHADTTDFPPPTEARRQLKEALFSSVALRLRSDVPLGCSLSGGLDSGIVTALARLIQPDVPLLAFTATWPGQPENEAELAKQVAEFTGAKWVEVPLFTEELETYWQEATTLQGYPLIHTSTLAQGKVMKVASDYGIKVMLDGQGGDELFGGYQHHANLQNQSFTYLMKALMETIASGVDPIYRLRKHPLSSCWVGDYPNAIPIATYRTATSLQALLIAESYGQPLKNLFRWADRSGMAYGIESRFPLADSWALQRIAFSLANTDAVMEGWTKHALRKVASPLLPEKVVWNKNKSAYGSPQHAWVIQNYPNWIETLPPALEAILMKSKLLNAAETSIRVGKTDWIFRVKALSEWVKAFIED